MIKKVNDARTGKRYKLSGVVRSVNQKAPPPLKEGTFSTMLEIYTPKKKKFRKKKLKQRKSSKIIRQMRIVIKNKGVNHVEDERSGFKDFILVYN